MFCSPMTPVVVIWSESVKCKEEIGKKNELGRKAEVNVKGAVLFQ